MQLTFSFFVVLDVACWCGFCRIMCVATHSVTGAQFPGTCYGISAANIFILHCFGCCMCLVSYFVTGARFPGTCYEMSELTFSYVIVADVSAVCLKSPLPIYKPLERIALGLLGLPRCYVFNGQSIGNTLLWGKWGYLGATLAIGQRKQKQTSCESGSAA